jgi:dihydrofolate reductase
MRRLIEATFVSVDGVIESQEKWAVPYFSGESKSEALVELASVDTFLLGRETYEKFAATWSRVKGDPYFDRVNSLRKLVASTTLVSAIWNAEIIKGDVADEVARLKRQPGKDIIKYGTGELDRELIEHNLIDEFRFSIFPVVVGSGRHLFEGIDVGNRKLELTETRSFSNGVVRMTYVTR